MQINFFKIKKSFKKRSTSPDPNFYWKIIMFSVFVLIAASFAFGYYMFNLTKEESQSYLENTKRKSPVEKERIQKALDAFSVKEKRSLEILNSTNSIIDPSL